MLDIDVSRRLGGFDLEARFSAGAGVTVLFGRSGAGKTSVINMIAGLLRPDRGRIAIDGRVLFDADRRIDLAPPRRRVGYVFQEGRLFPHMTVRQNLLFGRWFAPRDGGGADFGQVVELLGIGHLLRRRPGDLSGGEKQRVAIGRALLAHPLVLLMDEPLASLDAPRKAEILPYLERLRSEAGIPIVYVSHSVDEVTRLADTLVLLSDGRVVASGPATELTSRIELMPLTGRFEAGAVIDATVAGHDAALQLSTLRFAGGTLTVPLVQAAPGANLRVRIRARDVALALAPPAATSILNILPGRVLEIAAEEGAFAEVRIDAGGAVLLARITRRSARALALAPGSAVHALIKSVAIDQRSLGLRTAADRTATPPSV